jgi:predicted ATPase
MLITIAVSGYRNLRDLVIPLARLNVVTGPNGSGKSNLFKAIRLLADVAQGRIISSLAMEGGLQSTLWAGPEHISRGMRTGDVPIQGTVRREPINLKLGFADEDYGYAIDLGMPPQLASSQFGKDPVIKAEAVWVGEFLRRSNTIAVRSGSSVQVAGKAGSRKSAMLDLAPFDSMMTHVGDPNYAPELLIMRERMRNWRIYDHFRTDREALARNPQVGTRTTALAADGSDLAAALQTIFENGDGDALANAVKDAFPGAELSVSVHGGLFEVILQQRGLLRPLRATELSDGTLRYLLLIAALLSPRPPSLLVLNEPETSLHPDLVEPLGRLITAASCKSQIIVVSHSAGLVETLSKADGSHVYRLQKELGETAILDVERPSWSWPVR